MLFTADQIIFRQWMLKPIDFPIHNIFELRQINSKGIKPTEL